MNESNEKFIKSGISLSSMVSEIAHMASGNELPVTEPDEHTVVLGQDRIGNQIPVQAA